MGHAAQHDRNVSRVLGHKQNGDEFVAVSLRLVNLLRDYRTLPLGAQTSSDDLLPSKPNVVFVSAHQQNEVC